MVATDHALTVIFLLPLEGAEPLPPADRVKSTVHAEATPPRGHTIAPDGRWVTGEHHSNLTVG